VKEQRRTLEICSRSMKLRGETVLRPKYCTMVSYYFSPNFRYRVSIFTLSSTRLLDFSSPRLLIIFWPPLRVDSSHRLSSPILVLTHSFLLSSTFSLITHPDQTIIRRSRPANLGCPLLLPAYPQPPILTAEPHSGIPVEAEVPNAHPSHFEMQRWNKVGGLIGQSASPDHPQPASSEAHTLYCTYAPAAATSVMIHPGSLVRQLPPSSTIVDTRPSSFLHRMLSWTTVVWKASSRPVFAILLASLLASRQG
jgi:hypothetical protein